MGKTYPVVTLYGKIAHIMYIICMYSIHMLGNNKRSHPFRIGRTNLKYDSIQELGLKYPIFF